MPIETVAIKGSVSTGITYSMNFQEWEALFSIGATLTEIFEWEMGRVFPTWFKEKVVAWYLLHNEVENHKADASRPKGKK